MIWYEYRLPGRLLQPGNALDRSWHRTGEHSERLLHDEIFRQIMRPALYGCGCGRWSGESDLELLNPSGLEGSSGSNLGSRLSYPVTDRGHIPSHGTSQQHAIVSGSGPQVPTDHFQ